MGKLTYVNRKISGVKLAQSIQRDIQKRIPKIGEEKKLAAVHRDPTVEIDVSGRQLGAEGITIVCNSLYNLGLTKLSRVEELNLSGNDLTASSLQHLRRALSVCPDIRDIDISNNKIELCTIDDMKEWRKFLECFSVLKCVRRLDFSGNPLGDIGVEILFSTYANESDIFIPYYFKAIGKSDGFDDSADANYTVEGFDIRSQGGHLYLASHPQGVDLGNITDVERKASLGSTSAQSSGMLGSSPHSSLDPSREPADIHGLRGIPYIILSNIGATDLSAMWMSYIIPDHTLPPDLLPHLPPLKEGPLAATIRKYDALTTCRGLILTENPLITTLGQRALKEAEERRDQDAATVEELMTNGQGRRRSSAVSDACSEDSGRRDANRRSSGQEDSFQVGSFLARGRKALNDSRYNLDRTRARIQLNVLKEKGVNASLLWKVVMRTVVVGRAILLDYHGPITIDGCEPTLKIDTKSSQRASTDSNFKVAVDDSAEYVTTSKDLLSVAMKALDVSTATDETNGDALDRKLPGDLPIDIWMKIILMAEDSDNITNRAQRLNIFHWARSRTAIAKELEYLSESTESQARRVIAKVKGLVYEL
ncbi:hypothetical protein H072_4582 [Dactylellina haptotyla CBS 200.50]|uniref:Leucine rich repeat protein n=1 Tax=Dactylellina haptotyla (strain CBS 200.50) TaxID=1284197 RepID=S8AES1_DACHA|nr:hypothetical protein H072_4582 [Dactylellina haptotyla CBS 200.50]